MSSRIANRVKIQTNILNRRPSVQQSVNKIKYHVVTCDYKNKNHFSSLCFSQRHAHCTPVPLYLNLQNRNLSSDAAVPQSAEKLSDLSSSDVVSKAPMDSWPELFKTISESKIVEIAQQTLLKVHDATGLPWWMTIVLTAYAMRTAITLPFSIIQLRNTAKLQAIKPKMDEIVKLYKMEANRAVSFHGWTESMARQQYMKNVKAEYNKLIVEYNCHPFKSYLLIFIQLPVWISFSFATRNLSYMIPRGDPVSQLTYLEMMSGGFGWVKDLTAVDPYMILPITCSLLNLAILEATTMFRDPTEPITKLQKFQKIFFRIMCVAMIPIATYLPAGTLLYWTSSSSFGLLQAFLFQSNRFHNMIGVPNLEGRPKTPYRFFYNNLKSRLHLTSK